MSEKASSGQRTEPCGCECNHVHQSLCDLFDGNVSPERAAEIRAEVASCPECMDRLRSEENIRALMRRCCSSDSAPVTLRQRITAEIHVMRFSQ